MDSYNTVENIYLLVIITALSVLQNIFFALKVEKECTCPNTHALAIERVSSAKYKLSNPLRNTTGLGCFCCCFKRHKSCVTVSSRNCMDAYPTFMAMMWCAGVCLSQAPAAFAGLLYLVVRHKYFIGYMGQTSQSTPGYLFGKRILLFLGLMCLVGVVNYLLTRFLGTDYKESVETFTSAASTLLLFP